jgi:hypothetical protein
MTTKIIAAAIATSSNLIFVEALCCDNELYQQCLCSRFHVD